MSNPIGGVSSHNMQVQAAAAQAAKKADPDHDGDDDGVGGDKKVASNPLRTSVHVDTEA